MDELRPLLVRLLLVRPPPLEASPPLRATAFLVLSLAEASPLFEVPRPVEEPVLAVLREALLPPAALLAELLLLDEEAVLFEAVDRLPDAPVRLLDALVRPPEEPVRLLVEPERPAAALERPLDEPERLRLLPPDALPVDEVLEVEEELLPDEALFVSAWRLRF